MHVTFHRILFVATDFGKQVRNPAIESISDDIMESRVPKRNGKSVLRRGDLNVELINERLKRGFASFDYTLGVELDFRIRRRCRSDLGGLDRLILDGLVLNGLALNRRLVILVLVDLILKI